MNAISRRQALGIMGVGAIAVPTYAKAAGFFRRNQLPLGVQLYTVAEAARTDLDAAFARLARIGYRTVELAGFVGKSPAELRDAAGRAGLKIDCCHVPAAAGPGDISLSGDLSRLAADLKILGIERIVMPIFALPASAEPFSPPENFISYIGRMARLFSADDWKRNAAFLNEKAAILRREGIALGYHNHNPEFAPVEKGTGLDILMKETDPAIFFEMDAGWVAAAGIDPIGLLKRYPGRFRMMHVKDIKVSTQSNFILQQDPTEVGSGQIDWKKLLPAAYKAGVRHFYVEQEPPFTRDRFDALEISFKYLSSLSA